MALRQWRTALIVSPALLAGCASNLQVTYHSDPPGAVVYSGNQNWGYAPVTLQYQISEEDRKRGYATLQGTQVKWASGATASVPSLKADLSIGYRQQFTFNRPENYPGREADVRFALELQRLAIMQRQAQAQENAAFWQMYNAINQQYQRQAPTYCTSTAFGSTVNTTCY